MHLGMNFALLTIIRWCPVPTVLKRRNSQSTPPSGHVIPRASQSGESVYDKGTEGSAPSLAEERDGGAPSLAEDRDGGASSLADGSGDIAPVVVDPSM